MLVDDYNGVVDLTQAGGILCLEFTNTVDNYLNPGDGERFSGYGDLIKWAGDVGILDGDEIESLSGLYAQRTSEGEDTLYSAKKLRHTIHTIFAAIMTVGEPAESDLHYLNRAVAEMHDHLTLVIGDDGPHWVWQGEADRLDAILWPVTYSAVSLLTSVDLGQMRECSGSSCTWLFYDTSKNRSRKWCKMGTCGNRAKAKRHYAKTKKKPAG